MKKLLLGMLVCSGLAYNAEAQLQSGTIAPNFTLQDINGVTHDLYKYLDSGYAVIIDISAAWCGPCWSAHNSHVFENLTTKYGSNGTVQAKKVKFIFVEGESQNTTAQLYGPQGGSGALYTQGDWVTGSNYPIIDNSSLNTPYSLGGFPTFHVICRDRLVQWSGAGWGAQMANESFWLDIIDKGCPTYAPAATGIDAKALTYNGTPYFFCNANPTVKFQNYSKTGTITSATIDIMQGNNVIATQNWSGTLAPYAVASVSVPPFTATQYTGYKFRVTASGDVLASNNISKDSIFRVYSQGNVAGVPYSQDFEALANYELPAKFEASSDGNSFVWGSSGLIGKNGSATKAVVFNFFSMDPSQGDLNTEMFIGNYKTDNAANLTLTFDYAHAQYATSGSGSNDKLEVMASTNCGQTWSSIWSKQGAQLQTHGSPVGGTTQFIPAATSDWKSESINLASYKTGNLMLKFKGTSDYGNLAWVDNIKVNSTTGIVNTGINNSVSLFPNPAKNNVSITFTLEANSDVNVQLIDGMGRIVKQVSNKMSAGAQKLDISTSDIAAGIYNVKITTGNGSQVERLTVVK